MSNLLSTLFRTVILDDAAFQEWRQRPNLFLRGLILIVVVSLVAGIATFGVNLVERVRPVNVDRIEDTIRESMEQQFRWNPGYQNPEIREMMEDMIPLIVDMVIDLTQVPAPLPRAFGGLFQAFGGWLSGALSSIGGWLFYGALVLIAVNLLGGTAKLADFLGMVAVSTIPGLLRIFGPIPCAGGLLGLAALIWTVIVYVKAVSVTTDLDIGKSILAVLAPAIVIVLLAILLLLLFIFWMVIIF
jgi:hypothetical protein